MSNGLRIEHLCDIIPKAQSWLAGSKLASFLVGLHSFQCTPDQNNRFGKKCIIEMKRFIIDMGQSPLPMFLLLSTWLVFGQSYS